MKKLGTSAIKLQDGSIHVAYVCFDHEHVVDNATSLTLLDLVQMAFWGQDSLNILCSLVRRAEAGEYVSPNKELPDFGVNDVNIWLNEPMALRGVICITNENTEYNCESANLQRFTFSQFWRALECWQDIQAHINLHGKSALLNQKLEFSFH
jgi:hypothetical protein